MYFGHGTTVYRLRAGVTTDPYSGEPAGADWDLPTLFEIEDAYVAQSSTSEVGEATRTQALESKSLYCDPEAPLARGDRIFAGTFSPPLPDGATALPAGTAMVGDVFSIDGFPSADPSPFTGWQPVMEVPLTRAVG